MTGPVRGVAVAFLAVALAGCAGPAPRLNAASRSSSSTPARCVSTNGLPDPACTPGAVNPDVTDDTIASTICRPGWTRTVRPPAAYTAALKRRQIAAYGYYAGKSLASYEEDHLIPLELGGAPKDPRNLWPEAGASPNPKDRVEDAAKRAVCRHGLTLAAARQGIASDWRALAHDLGVHV